MKIETYKTDLTSGESFTFPINPTVLDDSIEFDMNRTDVPFDNKHIFITKGTMKPRTVGIQGYFTGDNKETNFQDLVKFSSSQELKKIFFSDDKFYLVLGTNFKQTRTGGRNNFLDYVGSFVTPIPFVFSKDYLQIYSTYSSSGSTTNQLANFVEPNGDLSNVMPWSYVTRIVISYTGSGRLDYRDGYNGGITLYLPSSSNVVYLDFIKMVDSSGFYVTEYWYAETEEGEKVKRKLASGCETMDIKINLSNPNHFLSSCILPSNISSGLTVLSARLYTRYQYYN